jgi:hypothetical protein
VNLPGDGVGFWLEEGEVEPRGDIAWLVAPGALRERFWSEASTYATRVWKRFRAMGLDRFGMPMKPIGPGTARARRDNRNRVTARRPYSPKGRALPDAPPLQATAANSRTQTLLRSHRVEGQGVWYHWIRDIHTGINWGRVLAHHARGFTKFFRYPKPAHFARVPSRDVVGFAPAEVAQVREYMGQWWAARRQAALPAGEDLPARLPVPARPGSLWEQRVTGPVMGPTDVLYPGVGNSERLRQQIERAARRGQWTGWRRNRGPSPDIFRLGRDGGPPVPPTTRPRTPAAAVATAPRNGPRAPVVQMVSTLSDIAYEAMRIAYEQAIAEKVTAAAAAVKAASAESPEEAAVWALIAELLAAGAVLPRRRRAG